MAPKTVSVRLEVQDEEIRGRLEELIASLAGFSVNLAGDPGHPDLLIFEIGENAEKEFELIRSISSVNPEAEIFLTSKVSDPSLLVQAIRAGVKNFLSQPLNEREVKDALKSFKERREKSRASADGRHGKVIDVIGGKGGVGATTLAVNLAASLGRLEGVRSVALLDMNLLTGEVPLFLDLESPYHWGEIVKNIARLDSTFLMSVLSKHTSGIYVLPSPNQLNGHFIADPGTIERLINLMRSVFDYIVVDGGQPLDDVSAHLLQMSDELIMVGVLSLPCLANMKRILKSYLELGYLSEEKVKIVINRYLKNSEVSIKDAEQSLGTKIYWHIPNDYATTVSAINQGKLIADIAPKAAVGKSVAQLSMALSQRKEAGRKRRGLFGAFRR